MTTEFFSVLHPTFESLSEYADMPELDAARSRVGRHVARCADCRQIVDEIRRLGDETRASQLEGAPDGLWSRIASAAVVAAEEQAKPRETPSTEAPTWESTPALRPTRHWPIPTRSATRIGLGLVVAAAAAIVAVLAWPTGQSLQASGLSRLTYSPARPVPGGTMMVRYQPSPWLKGASRLVLVGTYALPAGDNPTAWWRAKQLGDSIATLLPTRDGAYEGRVRLPKDFLAMQIAVTDSAGEQTDADGWFLWGVIAGEPTGAPSLRALLAAQETFAETNWGEGAAQRNARINVPDSLKRYFPAHPAGWAFSRDYGVQKGAFSFLRFFQTAERRYLSLYEQLWPAKSLDAERLHDMVVFAWSIEEPAQADLWAKRLAREHPEDPRALPDLAAVLHEVELRQPKGLADSIRPWFPLFDTLYRRSPTVTLRNSEMLSLVDRYADSATKALWNERFAQSRGVDYASNVRSDVEVRALTPSQIDLLRGELGKECIRPAGKFRLFGSSSDEIRRCRMIKANATRTLAYIALLGGDARGALALVDSSLGFQRQAQRCFYGWSGPHRIGARARLALGDTAAAERDLVAVAPFFSQGRDSAFADSARMALGRHFDAKRWTAAVESNRVAYGACADSAKAERDSAAKIRRARSKL